MWMQYCSHAALLLASHSRHNTDVLLRGSCTVSGCWIKPHSPNLHCVHLTHRRLPSELRKHKADTIFPQRRLMSSIWNTNHSGHWNNESLDLKETAHEKTYCTHQLHPCAWWAIGWTKKMKKQTKEIITFAMQKCYLSLAPGSCRANTPAHAFIQISIEAFRKKNLRAVLKGVKWATRATFNSKASCRSVLEFFLYF